MSDRQENNEQIRLSRFWDDLVRNDVHGAAGIDPELASAIEWAHSLPGTELPDPRYVKNVKEVVMNVNPVGLLSMNGATALPWTGRSMTAILLPNRRGFRFSSRRVLAAASVALVAALLMLFAGQSLREQGPQQPAVVPAMTSALQATPSASPASNTAFDQSSIELLWETNGDPASPFIVPVNLAADPSGKTHVINAEMNRIDVLAPDGNYLESWGEAGKGPGQFAFHKGENYGGDIGFDADGNAYVFDTLNDRIQKFDPTQTFLKEWGSSGIGDGQFYWPYGAIDTANALIYVADLGNHRVQVFDLEGNFVRKWGRFGTRPGELRGPSSIAIDSSGVVYVGDGNGHVQRFDPGGKFLSAVGEDALRGSATGVGIDANDNVYILRYYENSISIFAPNGELISTVTEIPGHGPIVAPSDIAFGRDGSVHVIEAGESNLLLKLQFPDIATEPA